MSTVAIVAAMVTTNDLTAYVGNAGSQHPWAMRYSDQARTSQSHFPGPEQGVVVWKWLTLGRIPTMSVAGNGNIYAGVTFHEPWWSGESYFLVLDSSGVPAWRHRVPPFNWSMAQGVLSGPALDANGDVVVNSAKGQVHRYDAGGQLLWNIQRRDGTPNDSSPAIDQDGFVYHYQEIDGLAKYTPQGAEVWRVSVLAQNSASVAVNANGECAIGGRRIGEPHGSTNITYLNANGGIRWQHTSTNGRNAQVIFSADGSLVYQGNGAYRSVDGTVAWGSPSTGLNALGKNGQYYLHPPETTSTIRAHNATSGALLWSKVLPVAGIHGMAIDSQDRIYVTSTDGYLIGISPADGSIFLNEQICTSFMTAPVIGTDGRLYAAGEQSGQWFIFSIL